MDPIAEESRNVYSVEAIKNQRIEKNQVLLVYGIRSPCYGNRLLLKEECIYTVVHVKRLEP